MPTARGYDSSAIAYFTAANITSVTEKNAANTFILTLKAAGIWTKMDRIYLRSPTSLAACLMCCKSLTSQTAVNSPTFSSAGLTFNGTSNYCFSDGTVSATLFNVSTTSGSIFCMFDATYFLPPNGIAGASPNPDYFALMGDNLV